jgi:rhodanese-related sulfurtransferase
MPYIAIDLRDRKTAEKEHLPNAVNIPLKELEKYKEKFPPYPKAPIILYADKDEEALEGFKIVRS